MSDTLTHAVTRPQPEAWALASGHCLVIPSDTRPDMRRHGELIGIHAGARWWTNTEWQEHFDRLLALKLSPPATYPRGALVGVARLVGVLRVRDGLYRVMRGNAVDVTLVDQTLVRRIRPWWRPGTKWGLLLDEAVPLSEPIPMRGGPGVWWMGGHTGAAWALEQWRKGRVAR